MEYQPFSTTPGNEGFQLRKSLRQKLANSKRRIQRRLDQTDLRGCSKPILTASNIHYEIAERTRGLSVGGIGAIHALANRLGLPQASDQRLQLLQFPLPYHESDHVLTLAYLPLCGGTCQQDLELLRHDEVFLDALGARRIPDPTTAGDFCRRFAREHLPTLHDVIDDTRLAVCKQQPADFFRPAVETNGPCKQGMDIAYDGTWGYHALVLTLANTGEVLRVLNRSGNRPSHEGAAEQVDQAVTLCFRGGFDRVLLRGDSKFSQSERLDGWDDELYHHTGGKYVSVKPNEHDRYAIPELELEMAILDGWVRYWYQGDLLSLPADLQREQDAARGQAEEQRQHAERAEQRAEALEREVAQLRRRLKEKPEKS